MSEIGLQGSGIVALVRQGEAAGPDPQNADGDGQKMRGANCFIAPINTLADQSSSHVPPHGEAPLGGERG
jgi:hypothetical protein